MGVDKDEAEEDGIRGDEVGVECVRRSRKLCI